MNDNPFPTRLDALKRSIEEQIESSSDGLVRVECVPQIDFEVLLKKIDPDEAKRFAVLLPFQFVGNRKGITSDPKEATRWRNEGIDSRRRSPIVVFGRAMGEEEAGLKGISAITEIDVLMMFERLGRDWLRKRVTPRTKAPERFFGALVQMARERLVDSCSLSDLCSSVFEEPAQAHVRPQQELWRLGLLPDKRVQDSKTPGSRLGLNQRTAEFLRSAPDGGADQKRWERLRVRSAEGNGVARMSLRYADHKERELLQGLDLDEVLAVLAPHKPPGKDPGGFKDRQTIDIFQYLDRGEDNSETADAFAELVDLDSDEISGTIELDKDTDLGIDLTPTIPEVHIAGSVREGPIGDDENEDEPRDEQILATLHHAGSNDPVKVFRATYLRSIAERTMRLLPADSLWIEMLGDGTNRYLETRLPLVSLERWASSLVEILILAPKLLNAARSHLSAWEGLVSAAIECDSDGHTKQLREFLSLLDGEWTRDENGDWISCKLFPTHPFVLAPAVLVAEFAIKNMGRKGLGEQVEWAADRTSPAYPAVWATDGTLLLHAGGSQSWPRFKRKPEAARPPVSRGQGLESVVRSYIGLQPFSKIYLTVLLVDPPPGKGVANAVRSISRLVERVRIYVATTDAAHATGVDLPEARHLGHLDLTKFAGLGIRANVIFCFRGARGSGVHAGRLQPSRGLHNALTVSASAPSLLDSESNDEWIPYVCTQPRDANDVVALFLKLARSSGREEGFFELRPLLSADEASELAQLSSICDWLVIATPTPIGLIPPRKFPNEDLVYIGREDLGSYTLFAYARDLYSVRRRVMMELIQAPLSPTASDIESQLEDLAIAVPNGVLHIGRVEKSVTPQVGLMAASYFSRNSDE